MGPLRERWRNTSNGESVQCESPSEVLCVWRNIRRKRKVIAWIQYLRSYYYML